MSQENSGDVTRLLRRWSEGDEAAFEQLLPMVYDELRRLARSRLRRERSDHTYDTSALVHEAYLRLIEQDGVAWQGRGHFFAIAAQAMRRLLVDHARERFSQKRGGRDKPLPLDEALDAGAGSSDETVLAVHEALEQLAALDRERAQLVELRYFVGLSLPEIAELRQVSLSTVERQWRLARAFLVRTLQPGASAGGAG